MRADRVPRQGGLPCERRAVNVEKGHLESVSRSLPRLQLTRIFVAPLDSRRVLLVVNQVNVMSHGSAASDELDLRNLSRRCSVSTTFSSMDSRLR